MDQTSTPGDALAEMTRQRDGAVSRVRELEDISERHRVEACLHESEERYRTLFHLAPVAVYSCDADGVIQEFNERAAALWGREPRRGDRRERFCGSFRLYFPDGRVMPHDQCPMARVLRGEALTGHECEILVEQPDGQL